jgi:hypothetical protein
MMSRKSATVIIYHHHDFLDLTYRSEDNYKYKEMEKYENTAYGDKRLGIAHNYESSWCKNNEKNALRLV